MLCGIPRFMFVFGGYVRDANAAVADAAEMFVQDCADRLAELYGASPKPEEQTSWKNSWPELLRALMAAGLGDLWLGLEYGLVGSGGRVDALLLGLSATGRLTAVVIELKQWTDVQLLPRDSLLVRAHGRVTPHPCRQAAGYVRYLQTWLELEPPELDVRATAILHNAPQQVIAKLTQAVRGQTGTGDVALLGQNDLILPQSELAERLGCAGLTAPSDVDVKRFVEARHVPAPALFDHLNEVLRNDSAFVLVDEQQQAQLQLLDAVRRAWQDGDRAMLVVTGGPGTGKTVIAARLLADIPRYIDQQSQPCRARYLTQSGTLRAQLERAASDPGAKGLFVNVQRYLDQRSCGPEVLLIDEAQRLNRAGNTVSRLLGRTRVSAFFLDERQIIKPDEGVTRAELEHVAEENGIKPVHVHLDTQFRCGGSQSYQNWLSTLLSPTGAVPEWAAHDYDVAVTADPAELSAWVEEHSQRGATARISAGYCWEWKKSGPRDRLRPEVHIPWIDARTGEHKVWARPWNARYAIHDEDGRPVAPVSTYWATDPGGDQQVGCIYTAQGLEYPYAGVIMGPDLVRRGNRWEAHPECSWDSWARHTTVDEYLRLALNIYWVLLTRGARGCRVYSTDELTQQFLSTVLPPAAPPRS